MNLYLREINKDDKTELLEMIAELNNDTLEDNFEGIRLIKGVTEDNFDEFLIELEKNKEADKYKPHLANQTTFILVDDNNHIYGGVNVRHPLNYNLLIHGGNIGYLIRTSERRKGYGTLMLKLALEECKKVGIKKALVTCREENIGSAKVIENNGGIYENSVLSPFDQNTYKRYWLDVK